MSRDVRTLEDLRRGDIVTHLNGESYIVLETGTGQVIAIRECRITNPFEWRWFDPETGEKRQLEPTGEE